MNTAGPNRLSTPGRPAGLGSTAVASLARDVRRINDTIMQIRPRGRFKVGADEFERRLEWLADQLTWVTHAMEWARRLADEATAGGPASAKQLAEAGTQLTAAICGARAVSILLTYDDFLYEVANAYKSPKLDEQQLSSFAKGGAAMAHESLDSVLARLSTRSPALVDTAADELLSYIQAPPKPIEASTKGGSGGSRLADPPAHPRRKRVRQPASRARMYGRRPVSRPRPRMPLSSATRRAWRNYARSTPSTPLENHVAPARKGR